MDLVKDQAHGMQALKKFLFSIKSFYYKIRSSSAFFNLVNLLVRSILRPQKTALDPKIASIVKKIKENGYIVMPATDLFDATEMSILQNQAEQAEESSSFVNFCRTKFREKSFLKRYSEIIGSAPLSDFLATETINGQLYKIACDYFGSIPRITNIDYWLNLPEADLPDPTASQLWHRDYEDKKLMKVFFYFTDVDEGNGAFSLVESTHFGSSDSNVFPTKPPLGVTVASDIINRHFGLSRVKKISTKRLTIAIADTSGLHRGGYCTTGDRFLFTSTFTSFAGISPRLFSVPKDMYKELNTASKISLRW